MSPRHGVAALMAAAAVASPAQASRGVVSPQQARLALLLPAPLRPPQFVVDPADTRGGAGNDLQRHVVTSGSPLGRFSRAHESFHSLDYDEFTDADRLAVARIIAPRRAQEAASGWWGATGAGVGGNAGLAEKAADYYATVKTGRAPRRLRNGMVVSDSTQSYTRIRDRRLQEFRQWLDSWARQRMR